MYYSLLKMQREISLSSKKRVYTQINTLITICCGDGATRAFGRSLDDTCQGEGVRCGLWNQHPLLHAGTTRLLDSLLCRFAEAVRRPLHVGLPAAAPPPLRVWALPAACAARLLPWQSGTLACRAGRRDALRAAPVAATPCARRRARAVSRAAEPPGRQLPPSRTARAKLSDAEHASFPARPRRWPPAAGCRRAEQPELS